MKKSKKAVPYKFNQVREKLDLASWQLHFAVEQGWIERNEKGQFNNRQIGALSKNPEKIHNKIWMHQEVNANNIAEFLGIKRVEFDWIIKHENIEAFGEGEFTYGTFKTYRRIDVAYLLEKEKIQKLLVIRKKQQKERRKNGAEKAKTTKQKNIFIKQDVKLQTNTVLDLTSTLPPEEAVISRLTFWLKLVSAYADIDNQGKFKSEKKLSSSQRLFKAKNRALQLLLSKSSPYISSSFISCPNTYLCSKCKQDCHKYGFSYHEYEGCPKCSIDHYYSILHTNIKTFAIEADFFTPYPIAENWNAPEPELFVKEMLQSYQDIKKPKNFPKKEWAALKSPTAKIKMTEVFISQNLNQYMSPTEAKKGDVKEWIALLPLNDTYEYHQELIDDETVNNKKLQLTYSREKSVEELNKVMKELKEQYKQSSDQ